MPYKIPIGRGNTSWFPHFDYLLRLPYKHRNCLPSIPAVYIVHIENLVLYVGQSICLRNRIRTHTLSRKFESLESRLTVAWMPVTGHARLLKIEQSFISQLWPLFNGTRKYPRLINIPRSQIIRAATERNSKSRIDPLKLKAARGRRSIDVVSGVIGVSPKLLDLIEHGQEPHGDVLAQLCWLYDVKVSDLVAT